MAACCSVCRGARHEFILAGADTSSPTVSSHCASLRSCSSADWLRACFCFQRPALRIRPAGGVAVRRAGAGKDPEHDPGGPHPGAAAQPAGASGRERRAARQRACRPRRRAPGQHHRRKVKHIPRRFQIDCFCIACIMADPRHRAFCTASSLHFDNASKQRLLPRVETPITPAMGLFCRAGVRSCCSCWTGTRRGTARCWTAAASTCRSASWRAARASATSSRTST